MNLSRISQVLAKFNQDRLSNFDIKEENPFIFGESEKFEIDVARDLETKIEAYQLMYRLYRNPELDYAKEDSSKMWYSIFNADPNTKTLVVKDYYTKKVVATLTIVLDTVMGLPLEENYPNQISNLRKNNRFCAEIISLGIGEDVRGSNEILIQLFKFAYLIYSSIYFATDFLIMIKPKHAIFYERKLVFKALGEEVNCKKINNKPVMLYHLDLKKAQEKTQMNLCHDKHNKPNNFEEIFESFVKAQNNKELIGILKEKVLNAEMLGHDLEYLFMQKKSVFRNTQPEVLLRLSELYNNEKTALFLKKCAQMHELECLMA